MMSCALALSGCGAHLADHFAGAVGSRIGTAAAQALPSPKAATVVTPNGGDWCAIAKRFMLGDVTLTKEEIAALKTRNLRAIVKSQEYTLENCK